MFLLTKYHPNSKKALWDGVCKTFSRLVEHMLEKFQLTRSFTRLAGAISPNIITFKSSRGSCKAKMAKLLLKFVIQERISVKEGDEAKEQLSKVINNLQQLKKKGF